MPDAFLSLSAADRREALAVAAAALGRPLHLLDKDVWLVWLLDVLFRSPFGNHLVFKGGSSLSKGYQIISRFSEDVDLTYDIRVLAPDLSGSALDPLPATRSPEKRWTEEIRSRLPVWIAEQIIPLISASLTDHDLPATLSGEGEKLLLEYAPLAAGSGYVRPVVMLEFGARSTGEPWESRTITCDAAPSVAGSSFLRPPPGSCDQSGRSGRRPLPLTLLRTGEFRGGERFSRHWHDLTRLDRAGMADAAIADRALALAVARHKSMFFPEKASAGDLIDYVAAVSGGLRLVPSDKPLASLSLDYARMLDDGLLMTDTESFETLLEQCRDLEARANKVK